MIDTHAHLNFKAFKDDLPAVLARAKEVGVEEMIVVGAALDTAKRAVELARKHRHLDATVGIHPHHIDTLPSDWLHQLTELARSDRVVAIGEIGLDYYTYATNGVTDIPLQKAIFSTQMELASERGLPVIIHCRDAWDDLLPLVAQYNKQKGVFHCWSGDLTQARQVLALGYYISFAGNLTYSPLRSPPAGGRRAGPIDLSVIQEVAKSIPLDRILLETDCPFLAPQAKRGLRNEPAFVTITGAFLAELRGVPVQEIDRVTTQNAHALFRFHELTS